MQYDDPMPRPGFDTYVFVERIAANAAALHPFPEHHVGLVREALADAGLEVSVLGPGAPEVGEAVYFQSEPMDDDALGLLADALTLRGIGAYATPSSATPSATAWGRSPCSPGWGTCSPAPGGASS